MDMMMMMMMMMMMTLRDCLQLGLLSLIHEGPSDINECVKLGEVAS
jgi:hypothetical protein